MTKKTWIAAGLSLPVIFFLSLDVFELLHARSDTAHLYPFGAEAAGWFYKSLPHYRLFLAIDTALAIVALLGVVRIWQGRKYFFVFYLPLFVWILYWIVTGYLAGY